MLPKSNGAGDDVGAYREDGDDDDQNRLCDDYDVGVNYDDGVDYDDGDDYDDETGQVEEKGC